MSKRGNIAGSVQTVEGAHTTPQTANEPRYPFSQRISGDSAIVDYLRSRGFTSASVAAAESALGGRLVFVKPQDSTTSPTEQPTNLPISA